MPVADALADRGIPFLFLTGYDRDHLPERHRTAPLVGKPYLLADLLGTLQRALGPAQGVPRAAADQAPCSAPPAPSTGSAAGRGTAARLAMTSARSEGSPRRTSQDRPSG